MKENTQEKSMVKINENSIFYKIKNFFRNLFNKNTINKVNIASKDTINTNQRNNDSSFMKNLKDIESEESKILKLQKAYRKGDIKENDMTEEQISSLLNLYDRQIANLKKSNEKPNEKPHKFYNCS